MGSLPRPLVRSNQGFIVAAVVAALLLGQWWLLLLPLAVGLTALLWRNPLFLAVRPFLRRPLTSYAQEDRQQQRFNQVLSVCMLAVAVLGDLAGSVLIGDVFAVMVGLAALVAILGYCVGCAVRYRLLLIRHRRQVAQASR